MVGGLVVFCATTETVTMRVTRSSSLALILILFFTEEGIQLTEYCYSIQLWESESFVY